MRLSQSIKTIKTTKTTKTEKITIKTGHCHIVNANEKPNEDQFSWDKAKARLEVSCGALLGIWLVEATPKQNPPLLGDMAHPGFEYVVVEDTGSSEG